MPPAVPTARAVQNTRPDVRRKLYHGSFPRPSPRQAAVPVILDADPRVRGADVRAPREVAPSELPFADLLPRAVVGGVRRRGLDEAEARADRQAAEAHAVLSRRPRPLAPVGG